MPLVEPHATGMLPTRDGAQIYWETSGDPDGVPLVWLHGGPGSGLGPGYRHGPDSPWHVVGLDQRACGRSTPLVTDPGFDLSTLTTQAMIGDIELLRRHLGIERWAVVGGSWGTTLAMAYAQAHPDRVLGLALALVTDGTAESVRWISESVGAIFPEQWERFSEASGHRPGQPLLDAYLERLTDPDPGIRAAAALAWCAWEDAHVSLVHPTAHDLVVRDPAFQQVFALQVAHSWANNAFLGDDGVYEHLDRITHLPVFLIHGRLDVSGPLGTAWRLHRSWPGSTLIVIDDEGHGGARLSAALRGALDELLPLVREAR
ncbi:alpha/beta fold hydrolase [Microbacterium sp. ASV49]|uniref:Proline iminopeptidase n=1 Tax=Microbacterium candidum TaxID=3041922 RepID=A0ABT7MYZ0_9MICO|nr:alpha/beta fold hydrolase [Microbacterium sp. ASV49]MDL9979671.1 alpha/beta fold hydrolase [Microbacterium sp. ASV49]